MRTTEVEIAGRTYVVKALPIRANKEWRQKYQKPFRDVVDLLAEASGYVDAEWEDTRTMVSQLGALLKDQLQQVAYHLLDSADIIADACFDYSPALQKDRKFIESNGFDEEMVGCFLRILEVAFPFGGLLNGLKSLPLEVTGQQEDTTESSSVEVS